MKQYLLSIYQPDAPPPPEVMARMDEIMASVNALVEETKAAGAWVFNGALHPPTTATVVRLERGDVLMTDGPYAEGKEHIGGFPLVKAARLRRPPVLGRRLGPRLPGRGHSLPGEGRALSSAT